MKVSTSASGSASWPLVNLEEKRVQRRDRLQEKITALGKEIAYRKKNITEALVAQQVRLDEFCSSAAAPVVNALAKASGMNFSDYILQNRKELLPEVCKAMQVQEDNIRKRNEKEAELARLNQSLALVERKIAKSS